MTKNYYLNLVITLAITIFLLSCGNDEDSEVAPNNEPSQKYLVSYDTIFTRDVSTLTTFLEAGGLGDLTSELKYNSAILRVVYNTKYKGETIEASGLILIPDTEDEIDILSFQHGTIASNAEAPSNLALQDPQFTLYSTISASGFIAVIPDYLGFGASSNIPHPYYVEDLNASSVNDMILAAKELAEEFGLNSTGDLYLAGYSQGGYATMAAHKAIEENALPGINLVASFPSSGGYDVKAFQEYFFTLETYHQPFFMAFVVNSYINSYDLSLGFSEVFQDPYDTRIPDFFDGSYSGSDINNGLNDTLDALLTEEILNGLDTDSKYNDIRQLLIDNSLTDWVPDTRMFMYHGDSDITVPYQNSVITYDKLIENGASETTVTFTPLPGGTHGTEGFLQYLGKLIEDVNALRMN